MEGRANFERGEGELQQEKGAGRCVIGRERRGDFSKRERGGGRIYIQRVGRDDAHVQGNGDDS